MDRRTFLAGAGAVLLAAPRAVKAQQPCRVPRLCVLTFDPGTAQSPSPRFEAFFQRLRDLGYVHGQTVTIDYYLVADGRGERFPELAAECVRLRADIIAVTTTPAARAAQNVTRTIPIVMVELGDPVGFSSVNIVAMGLVQSLARPGGNVTGVTTMAPGLSAKRLELLKAAAPRVSRVLVLAYLVDPIAMPQIEELKKAAPSVGVQLQIRNIGTADDLSAAFDDGAKEGAEALLTTSASIFIVHRARLTELAARHRLPAIYSNRLVADAGGLMAYDANRRRLEIASATYVDKILKGANPGDLPVEQPTKFDLVINLKTAKALGLTLPPSLLQRADQVIE
jgi:putative tryptophan/tyrosine transport system substrate-binding protein